MLFHELSRLIIKKSTDTWVQKFLIIPYIYTDSFQIITSEQFWNINKIRSVVISEIIHVAHHT